VSALIYRGIESPRSVESTSPPTSGQRNAATCVRNRPVSLQGGKHGRVATLIYGITDEWKEEEDGGTRGTINYINQSTVYGSNIFSCFVIAT